MRSPSWCGNVAMGTCLILWEDYRTLPEVQPLFRFTPPRKDAVLFVDGCPHTEQTHDTHSIDKMTSWQSLLVILTYVSLGFLHQLIYLRTRFSFIRLHALVSSGGKADNSSPRHFVEIKIILIVFHPEGETGTLEGNRHCKTIAIRKHYLRTLDKW